MAKMGKISEMATVKPNDAKQTNAAALETTSQEKMFRLLKVVAEQAAEGIIVADAMGIIRFANPAAIRMHGYALRTDLLGKNLSILHNSQQRTEHLISFMQNARRLGQFSGPLDHVRKDGTVLHTDTKMTFVHDETGHNIGLIVFHIDTTEREQAKAALDSANAQLTKAPLQHDDRHDAPAAKPASQPAAVVSYKYDTQNYDPYELVRKDAGGPLDTGRLQTLADLLKRLS